MLLAASLMTPTFSNRDASRSTTALMKCCPLPPVSAIRHSPVEAVPTHSCSYHQRRHAVGRHLGHFQQCADGALDADGDICACGRFVRRHDRISTRRSAVEEHSISVCPCVRSKISRYILTRYRSHRKTL